MNHKKHLFLVALTGGFWIPVYLGVGLYNMLKVGVAKGIISIQEEVKSQSK